MQPLSTVHTEQRIVTETVHPLSTEILKQNNLHVRSILTSLDCYRKQNNTDTLQGMSPRITASLE